MKQFLTIIFIGLIGYSANSQDWNFSATPINETCFEAGDGSINITMSGNINNRIFLWEVFADEDENKTNILGSGTVGDFNPDIFEFLDSGKYVVVVLRDGTGETRERAATVVGSTSALSVSKEVTNNLCNGGNSGTIQVTAEGGSGTYEYGLSFGTGASSPNLFNYSDNEGLFEGLSAGTYTAWVRDEFGCERSNIPREFGITQPASITITFDTINADCNNIGGQIDLLTISGGTPFAAATSGAFNYEIEWFDDQGTQLTAFDNKPSLTGLDSGQYSVTITDRNGCNGSSQFQLSKGFLFEINSIRNVTCASDDDGQIQVKLGSDSENDEAPFELRLYDGNDEEITAQRKTNIPKDSVVIFEDLGFGDYRIVAEDNNGCELELEQTLTQPDDFKLESAQVTDVVCKGVASGEIAFSSTGGAGTIQYSITGDKDTAGTDWSSSETRGNLSAGKYYVWIRDDNASSCEVFADSVEVDEPRTQYGIERIDVTNVTCNGDGNGSAVLVYTSDTDDDHPRTISWLAPNDDVINNEAGNPIRTQTLTGLSQGVYTLSIADDYGCDRTQKFQVFEPNPLTINATVTTVECPSPFGGEAKIDASLTNGGTFDTDPQSLTYIWKLNDEIVDNDSIYTPTGLTGEITPSLTVTDENGCTDTRQFTITIPDRIAVTVNPTMVACKGDSTGGITLEITGGTPFENPNGSTTYDVSWVDSSDSTVNLNDVRENRLAAGVYTYSVFDENSCGPVTGDITITEPSTSYSLSGTVTPIICNGETNGKIDVTINRVTASGTHPNPTTIEWTKDGAVFASDVIDLENLESGNYTITTEDDFGCSRSLTFEVDEYPTLLINPTVVQNTCFGDTDASIEINPVGGFLGSNLNYSVRWFKDGTVQGTQNNQSRYRNLEDGTYRIEVTDSVGCRKDTVITLKAPDPISSTTSIGNIKCKGDENGYLSLDISGGTPPYIILWKEEDNDGTVVGTEDSIFNLSPGDYFVTIEDQNDCAPFTDTLTVSEPATDFNISITPKEIQCINDRNGEISIEFGAIGAGHPDDYTLQWFKDGTLLSGQTNVTQSGITPIANLGPGNYELNMTDFYGCERSASYELVNPTQIFFNPEIDSITCTDLSDGSITLDPVGGYGDFSVTWSSEANGPYPDTDFELSEIPGGRYTITLTDGNGCELDTVIFLNNPQPIVATPTVINTTCVEGSDGSISLSVRNGNAPYLYQWFKDGALVSTDKDITELNAGTYNLTIRDRFQCELTSDVVVTDPPSAYAISGEIGKVTCRDDLDGSIDVTVSITGNPDLDYSVSWEKDGEPFSQNTEDLDGVGAGTYEIFVEDQYGCEKSRVFTIENPDELTVEFQVNDVSCFGGTDGSLSAQVSGGYGSYTYEWQKDLVDFSVTGSFANNLEAAFYRVTISDAEGCLLTRTVEVAQPDPFLISLSAQSNTCATPFDSEIAATVTGGVQPYSFQWLRDGLPFAKTEDLEAIPAGTYQLMAVDTNFCETSSVEVVITAPERLGINIIELDDNLCPTTENGSLSIQGTGGSFPYTYSFDSAAYSSVNNFVNLGGRDYLVSIQDNVGCTFDTVLTIRNQYELEPEFSLTTEAFAIDFPITLNDESLGEAIVSWLWDFGDTRASEDQNTSVTYTTPGTYALELTIENEVGCSLSKVDTLFIERGFNFTVPTAFTPNGDGSNDNFRPAFQNIDVLVMKIQNRDGLVVFESSNLSASWDGTFNGNDVPQGAYFYEIIYTPKSGISRTAAGKIMVLR